MSLCVQTLWLVKTDSHTHGVSSGLRFAVTPRSVSRAVIMDSAGRCLCNLTSSIIGGDPRIMGSYGGGIGWHNHQQEWNYIIVRYRQGSIMRDIN